MPPFSAFPVGHKQVRRGIILKSNSRSICGTKRSFVHSAEGGLKFIEWHRPGGLRVPDLFGLNVDLDFWNKKLAYPCKKFIPDNPYAAMFVGHSSFLW